MRAKLLVRVSALDPSGAHSPASKCGPSLESWGQTVLGRTDWNSLADVKKLYPRADQVGRRTVFNISGYQFRLVARMNCLRGPRVVETEQETEHKHLLQQVREDMSEWLKIQDLKEGRSNVRFPSWTSRVRSPSPAPSFQQLKRNSKNAVLQNAPIRDFPAQIPVNSLLLPPSHSGFRVDIQIHVYRVAQLVGHHLRMHVQIVQQR